MARKTTHRWRLSGALVALDPIHVGGVGTDPVSDMPLARDGQGRLYVPGTSLAGAVRALAGKALGGAVEALFGYQLRDEGHASFCLIEDALLVSGSEPELRQGVGIDRETGAAAKNIKYDREVLPVGSRFGLEIVLEGPVMDAEGAALMDVDAVRGFAAALKARLEQAADVLAPFCVGGGKTRGLGRLRLEDAVLVEWELATPRAILDLALGVNGEPPRHSQSLPGFAEPGRWAVAIAWTQGGPVYTKADCDGFIVDALPVVTEIAPAGAGGAGAKLTFVLSGAGIKGVLRSHAERIVRTVRGQDVEGDFLAQVKVELVDELFGAAGRRGEGGRRGAVYVRDCRADVALDAAAWAELALAGEGEQADPFGQFNQRLRAAGLTDTRIGHHVAIDRWTGGAADGLLFSVLETHGVTWRPIELTVEVGSLPPGIQDAAVALLCLVLRDLEAGRLPLGFGGNRGMGEIAVQHIDLRRGVGANAVVSPGDLLGQLGTAWNAWVAGPSAKAPDAPETKQGAAKMARATGGGRGQANGNKGEPPPPPQAEAFLAGVSRWRRDAVELNEALKVLSGEAIAGLFYTPNACHVARRVDDGWKIAALAADHASVAESPLPFEEVFEARAFDGTSDLRWQRQGAAGTAVLVAETGTTPKEVDAWGPAAAVETTKVIDREQPLWGEVAVTDGAWAVVHEDRVGPHAIPCGAAAKDRLGLAAREYVAVLGDGHARGNAYIAEERLIGFIRLE